MDARMILACPLPQALVSAQDAMRAEAADSAAGSASARKDAATGGLFISITLAVASAVSRFLFHRDFLGSQGWGGFVAGIVSMVIAAVGVALTAMLAALIVQRLGRRLGGSDRRAAAC